MAPPFILTLSFTLVTVSDVLDFSNVDCWRRLQAINVLLSSVVRPGFIQFIPVLKQHHIGLLNSTLLASVARPLGTKRDTCKLSGKTKGVATPPSV